MDETLEARLARIRSSMLNISLVNKIMINRKNRRGEGGEGGEEVVRGRREDDGKRQKRESTKRDVILIAHQLVFEVHGLIVVGNV